MLEDADGQGPLNSIIASLPLVGSVTGRVVGCNSDRGSGRSCGGERESGEVVARRGAHIQSPHGRRAQQKRQEAPLLPAMAATTDNSKEEGGITYNY
mmetsp:Transcript_78578/g.163272  ORF Transcript_78578/g.163272 Transcript_78578/m.163272 type:complete len:97 (-) Transcript_78578:174-464(-)